MENFDTIIVGTGPAGLGAAFVLSDGSPQRKILMIDKEKISTGGLRNDCKMNFSFPIGFPKDVWNAENAAKYLERIIAQLKPDIMEKYNLDIYRSRAEKIGVQLLYIRQSHLGTDGGIRLIRQLMEELGRRGVGVALEEKMVGIDPARRVITTDKRELGYRSLVVAPGRGGFNFLQDLMKELKVPFSDNSIDIGIRVETREEHYPIVRDYYDPKFLFPEGARTFCTNSGSAHVVQEKYMTADGETYYSVNGHAYSGSSRKNGLVNFAILRSVAFTEPLASGQRFAEMLGVQAMLIGGGHPIMQRVGDFRLGKRSTREHFTGDLYDFTPTLASSTPGDISLAMPSKILRSIWKSMKLLDTIVPGILHPSTVMYYPEIKLYANKPRFIDDNFQAYPGVYLIGDGAGTSRGITGAWASGMRAADGILARKEG